jgi:hypothetical protein
MAYRKAFLLAVLVLIGHGSGMAAPVQLSAKQTLLYEKDLAHWKALLDEYHQGKRNDNDGGAILFHVLSDYGVLGSSRPRPEGCGNCRSLWLVC